MSTTTPDLTRRNDWPEQLDALLRSRAATPFEWGQHDCCLFAADVVLALTGHDPMATLRGRYSNQREAMRLLDSLGGYEAAITRLLGPRTSSMLVTVGDQLLIHNAGRPLLAVCNGIGAVAPTPTGLLVLPVVDVICAWRIA